MYFTPIFLTPIHPFFYQAPLQQFTLPQIDPVFDEYLKKNSLNCAAQKFKEMILEISNSKQLPILTNYMNLNKKYSATELPGIQEFATFYNSIVDKYRITYGNTKIKHSWSKQDVKVLLWIINWIYQTTFIDPIKFSKSNWIVVASVIPFRSGEDCLYKWLSMRNNQLEESPWTVQEKNQLAIIMQSNQDFDWIYISKELHRRQPKNYRTPKQCKESWSIILSERYQRSKKFWSFEEDSMLVDAFSQFGRRWKEIAKVIKGRSQNAIKNRFTLLSQKHCHKEIVSKNDRDLIFQVKAKIMEEYQDLLPLY